MLKFVKDVFLFIPIMSKNMQVLYTLCFDHKRVNPIKYGGVLKT